MDIYASVHAILGSILGEAKTKSKRCGTMLDFEKRQEPPKESKCGKPRYWSQSLFTGLPPLVSKRKRDRCSSSCDGRLRIL